MQTNAQIYCVISYKSCGSCLFILQNKPLCILFSSSNGKWLASIFFKCKHMAIIKFRAHKIDMIFVGRQVPYVSVVFKTWI